MQQSLPNSFNIFVNRRQPKLDRKILSSTIYSLQVAIMIVYWSSIIVNFKLYC